MLRNVIFITEKEVRIVRPLSIYGKRLLETFSINTASLGDDSYRVRASMLDQFLSAHAEEFSTVTYPRNEERRAVNG